jgi:hypothetical protein
MSKTNVASNARAIWERKGGARKEAAILILPLESRINLPLELFDGMGWPF